jgi:hypothetical protein
MSKKSVARARPKRRLPTDPIKRLAEQIDRVRALTALAPRTSAFTALWRLQKTIARCPRPLPANLVHDLDLVGSDLAWLQQFFSELRVYAVEGGPSPEVKYQAETKDLLRRQLASPDRKRAAS